MEIREERADDHAAVDALHRAAFARHPDQVAALVADLRATTDPEELLSLVADRDGDVVGHVMFSPGWLDAPRRLVAAPTLSPLGVLPADQRQGVGTALVTRGVELMAQRGMPAVFLEGDPAYYRRLGFIPGTESGFRRPSLRIPSAAFQVRKLPAYEPWMTGSYVYRDVFWRHDAVGLRTD